MDQCTHCTLKGNLEACEKVKCGHHDLWYVSALKANARNNIQKLKDEISILADEIVNDLNTGAKP